MVNYLLCFVTILSLEGDGNGNWYRKIWEYGNGNVMITKHNETPTMRGLATDNNNMQSVLMENMETIWSYKHNLMK